MEYFELGTLQDLYDHNMSKTVALKESVVRQVIAQLAHALLYCLSQGVVHRDVKPANIAIRQLTEASCDIVLIDFGEAFYHYGKDGKYDPKRDGNVKECKMRGRMGTFTAAPEMWVRDYTYMCDCYSVGVVAFFLLFGRYPWPAKDQQALREAATKPNWEKNDSALAKVSEIAYKFLTLQITDDLTKRMTYEQMLAHEWLQTPTVDEKSAKKSI